MLEMSVLIPVDALIEERVAVARESVAMDEEFTLARAMIDAVDIDKAAIDEELTPTKPIMDAVARERVVIEDEFTSMKARTYPVEFPKRFSLEIALTISLVTAPAVLLSAV